MKKQIAKIEADAAFLDMARNGARMQLDKILGVFPELRNEVAPPPPPVAAADTKHQPTKGGNKVQWTPAMRKRHSAMMKARWASKRGRK